MLHISIVSLMCEKLVFVQNNQALSFQKQTVKTSIHFVVTTKKMLMLDFHFYSVPNKPELKS